MYQTNVKRAREDRGLNQRQLAEAAHMPASLISVLENGKRRIWPAAAQRLSKALNVPISHLFPEDFTDGE